MEAVVLLNVGFLEYFCPKQGQDFKASAAPLYPNMGQVPPTSRELSRYSRGHQFFFGGNSVSTMGSWLQPMQFTFPFYGQLLSSGKRSFLFWRISPIFHWNPRVFGWVHSIDTWQLSKLTQHCLLSGLGTNNSAWCDKLLARILWGKSRPKVFCFLLTDYESS